MSTRLQNVQLTDIWSYGREAFANRRKELFLIALFFLVLPEAMDLFVWNLAATKTVLALSEPLSRAPIDQLEYLFSVAASMIAPPAIALGLLKTIGVLMLARTSIDYFESQPRPLGSVAFRSISVLIKKGLGTLLALAVILPITSLIPFVAVITLSLLVMLPVTMVTSSKGGFRTSFDTLFLNYTTAARVGGKLPIFMNIVTVAGFFLTLTLGIEFLIELSPELDLLLQTPSGFFGQDINFFGIEMNAAKFIANCLNILWESSATAMIIPFTAAIYHLTTAPEGHQDFQTVI